MIEDIFPPLFFGIIIWIWGNWLQKTVHRRENDNAQFPKWVYHRLFYPGKKISRASLLAKIFSVWVCSYTLVALRVIEAEVWKSSAYFILFPLLTILVILENWGDWFK